MHLSDLWRRPWRVPIRARRAAGLVHALGLLVRHGQPTLVGALVVGGLVAGLLLLPLPPSVIGVAVTVGVLAVVVVARDAGPHKSPWRADIQPFPIEEWVASHGRALELSARQDGRAAPYRLGRAPDGGWFQHWPVLDEALCAQPDLPVHRTPGTYAVPPELRPWLPPALARAVLMTTPPTVNAGQLRLHRWPLEPDGTPSTTGPIAVQRTTGLRTAATHGLVSHLITHPPRRDEPPSLRVLLQWADRLFDEAGEVRPPGDANFSDAIAVGVVAFSKDGGLLLLETEGGLRLPATGDLHPSDLGRAGAPSLVELVRAGADRELVDACAIPLPAEIVDDFPTRRKHLGLHTLVTGFARHLQDGARPRFLALSWLGRVKLAVLMDPSERPGGRVFARPSRARPLPGGFAPNLEPDRAQRLADRLDAFAEASDHGLDTVAVVGLSAAAAYLRHAGRTAQARRLDEVPLLEPHALLRPRGATTSPSP